MHKNKKNKWIKYLIFSLIGLKVFSILRNKNKKINKNFHEFLKKERLEIDKLKKHEESKKEFIFNSKKILKDFFIPHAGNNYKPKILRSHSLAIIVISLFGLKMLASFILFFAYLPQAEMTETLPQQILVLINKDREANNLPPLKSNQILEKAALAKAQDMINKNYFSHQSPNGKMPWDFIDRGEYAFLYAGENLAMNFTQADSVHKALMSSPPHKKNILNKNYQDIGIAVLHGTINGEETNILVEIFGGKPETKLVINNSNLITQADQKIAKIQTPLAHSTSTNVLTLKQENIYSTTSQQINSYNTIQSRETKKAGTTEIKIKKSTTTLTWEKASSTLVNHKNKLLTKAETRGKTIQIYHQTKPEVKAINFNNELQIVKAPQSNKEFLAHNFNQAVKIILFVFLIILLVALIINILVEITIQHHIVIIQSLAVIIIIIGLAELKLGLLGNLTYQYIAIL